MAGNGRRERREEERDAAGRAEIRGRRGRRGRGRLEEEEEEGAANLPSLRENFPLIAARKSDSTRAHEALEEGEREERRLSGRAGHKERRKIVGSPADLGRVPCSNVFGASFIDTLFGEAGGIFSPPVS